MGLEGFRIAPHSNEKKRTRKKRYKRQENQERLAGVCRYLECSRPLLHAVGVCTHGLGFFAQLQLLSVEGRCV